MVFGVITAKCYEDTTVKQMFEAPKTKCREKYLLFSSELGNLGIE